MCSVFVCCFFACNCGLPAGLLTLWLPRECAPCNRKLNHLDPGLEQLRRFFGWIFLGTALLNIVVMVVVRQHLATYAELIKELGLSGQRQVLSEVCSNALVVRHATVVACPALLRFTPSHLHTFDPLSALFMSLAALSIGQEIMTDVHTLLLIGEGYYSPALENATRLQFEAVVNEFEAVHDVLYLSSMG